MSISPNAPRPDPPPRQPKGNLSWIFFLLILARPLWGILRSAVGPQLSNTQLWIVVIGVLALAALVLLAPRALNRGPSVTRLPTSAPSVPPRRPPALPQHPALDASLRPPHYEPIITGKVMLAGVLLLGMMGLGFVLLLLV